MRINYEWNPHMFNVAIGTDKKITFPNVQREDKRENEIW